MGWQNVWSTERSLIVVAKWAIRIGILGFLGALGTQIAKGTPLETSAILAQGFETFGMAEKTSIPWPNGTAWTSGWDGVIRSDRALAALPVEVIQAAKATWWISISTGVFSSIFTIWLLMRSPAMREEDPDHRRGSVASEQADLIRRLRREED